MYSKGPGVQSANNKHGWRNNIGCGSGGGGCSSSMELITEMTKKADNMYYY